MGRTEVRVIGDEGEVIAVVKLVKEGEEEEVRKILLKLCEVGNLEIWKDGLFVGLIESEN